MTRVFIADDHEVVREGLKRIVQGEPDFTLAGEAADGDAVLRALESTRFDVLLLDLSMPGRTGLDVLRRVKADQPQVRVVVLTMHAEDQYALRVLKAGADGYLTKGRSTAELIEAIRCVAGGGKYVTGTLGALLLDSGTDVEAPAHAALTPRELEVLVMVGRGTPPSQVAHALELSPSTVSTHLKRIRTKLGLESLGALVGYAVREGLVDEGAR